MTAESFFDVQVAQAEENAVVADLVDRHIALSERVERFMGDVRATAAVRAARPQRRGNGKKRPPGHLSRQMMDVLERLVDEQEQIVSELNAILREGRTHVDRWQ